MLASIAASGEKAPRTIPVSVASSVGSSRTSARSVGLLLLFWAVLLPPAVLAQVRVIDDGQMIDRGVWDHLQRISGRSALLVRGSAVSSLDQIPLTRTFSVAVLPSGEEPASGSAFWSPPRRLLLDQAVTSSGLTRARARLGQSRVSGAGVIIGMVDSGLDLTHPDLGRADGSSRVVWWLDFGLAPAGLYPELELELGCDALGCAVLGAAELDALRNGEEITSADGNTLRLPADRLGHGTHVTSLAAGNGASNPDYAGMAPEADIIVARVASNDAIVNDIDVLLSARFIFERAEEMGQPAVINMSLGGDFGPHDGTSGIALALSEFVGDEHPGRAIVVAAGNSATLTDRQSNYPGPFGVHTQVHVTEGTKVRVPILTPEEPSTNVGVFVWIDDSPGDALRVGLTDAQGAVIHDPLGPGEERQVTDGFSDISLIHHADTGDELDASEQGIALLATGELEDSSVYALTLEGHGTAELWVQSEGGWGPGSGSVGAVFPRALKEGTITVPADSPGLISVGAVLNRTSWSSARQGNAGEGSVGQPVTLDAFEPTLDFRVGSIAFFSSAGPNSQGVLKPDVVSPGAVIIGAMASAASPLRGERPNASSMFFSSPVCAQSTSAADCTQADEHHAVAVGTSMAAPLVTGAIALLLQQDHSLTQPELRALLQAGATNTGASGSHAGAGALNVNLSLHALTGGSKQDAQRARIIFADSVAYPAENKLLNALVQLRDSEDQPTDVGRLEVEVSNAELRARHMAAPGLLALTLSPHAGAGGKRLQLRVMADGTELAQGSIPLQVDRNAAFGVVAASGGCTLRRATNSSVAPTLIGFLLAGLMMMMTRRRNVPRC